MLIKQNQSKVAYSPKNSEDIFAQTNIIPSGLDDALLNFYNPDIPSGLFLRNPKYATINAKSASRLPSQ